MNQLLIILFSCVLAFMAGCGKKETDVEKPSTSNPSSHVAPKTDLPVKAHSINAIPLSLPSGHDLLTVVIDDDKGVRVRNLLAMKDIASLNPQNGKVTVSWDGKDDLGNVAPPGRYKVRGLTLPRLKAQFDHSFYGPGTPPWEYYQNSGWGSDHAGVVAVSAIPASAGLPWQVIFAAAHAEGGDALFALNSSDRKVFGYKRGGGGAESLAYDDGYIYAASHWLKAIVKFNPANGKTADFQKTAGVIKEIKIEGGPWSLAVKGTLMAVCLTPDDKSSFKEPKISFFEKKGGKLLGDLPLTEKGYLAFASDGTLYLSQEKGGISKVVDQKTLQPITLEGLAKPGPMAISKEGSLFIMDNGPDFQIKVYSPEGKMLKTIGTRGGRGQKNAYDEQALQNLVTGISLDEAGNVWTVEPLHPRRQAMWSPEGKVIKQFIGCTQYGATHTTLHDQDPTLAEAAGVLFRVDPAQTQSYKPLQYLSTGPKEGGIPYDLTNGGDFMRATLFRSDASGKSHEYLVDFIIGYPVMLLFVKRGDDYRPCAGIVWRLGNQTKIPGFPDAPAGRIQFWSDTNSDEIPQESELTLLDPFPDGKAWRGGGIWEEWSWPMNRELVFGLGGRILKPVKFLEDGTPLYDFANAPRMKASFDTSYYSGAIKVGEHFHVIQISPQYFQGNHVFLNGEGKIIARYPYTAWSVHGSMQKPPPEPGQTTGELFMSGTAPLSGDNGWVMAWHGNYGQAFFFTEDGLFVSSLFKDVRQGPAGYGETVVKGADWTDVTMQQENFGGWFGRQEDGQYRYSFGRNSLETVRILNMDQIKKFDAGWVEISSPAK